MKPVIFILAICQALYAEFAFDLKENGGSSDGNWVYSPLSIASCLSMVADGARNETAKEMYAALKLPDQFTDWIVKWNHTPSNPTDYELKIAQGVWVKADFPILSSYRDTLQKTYRAALESVLFFPETADQINAWVEEQTHEKIKNLISPSHLSQDTRLVLVNALYFKGSWLSPFDVANTRSELFYSTPTRSLSASFMDQIHSFPYYENGRFKAVALPLNARSNNGFEPLCLLILPHQNGDDPFTSASIRETLDSLQHRKVHLRVPKFKFDHSLNLNEPLKQLGMRAVFSHLADLSGINGMCDLHVSDVLHKAFIAFEEKGIEAAAATAAVVNCTTAISPPVPLLSFIADHPFYFVLIDRKTKTILFMGQVQNPCI